MNAIGAIWQRTLKKNSKCAKLLTQSTHIENNFQRELNLVQIEVLFYQSALRLYINITADVDFKRTWVAFIHRLYYFLFEFFYLLNKSVKNYIHKVNLLVLCFHLKDGMIKCYSSFLNRKQLIFSCKRKIKRKAIKLFFDLWLRE